MVTVVTADITVRAVSKAEVDTLLSQPAGTLVPNTRLPNPSSKNLWHFETYTLILKIQCEPESEGISHPELHMPKLTKPPGGVFLFSCWHANNTSVVVYARDTVSPLTKTKDQNKLCSRTLCSVAREFMKDFYLWVLGLPTGFL